MLGEEKLILRCRRICVADKKALSPSLNLDRILLINLPFFLWKKVQSAIAIGQEGSFSAHMEDGEEEEEGEEGERISTAATSESCSWQS